MLIKKHELVAALGKVRATVAANKMVEALRNFVFKDGRIMTFDGKAGTVTKFDLEGMEFAVPADKFWRVINSLFQEIDISLSGNQLKLKSGGNTTKLGIMPTYGFPEIIPTNLEMFCDADNFVEALEKVSFTISTNATKPALMGVGVTGSYVYSSDGKRISRAKLKTPALSSLNIPGPSVEHIVKLGQPKYFFSSGGQCGALYPDSSSVYVTSSLAQAFPTQTVDQMFTRTRVEVTFPNDLADAIQRVSLLAGEESSLTVESDGTSLILTCQTAEVGEAKEALAWESPYRFSFTIRSEFLKEGFLRSKTVDISDVVAGGAMRSLCFIGEDFEHLAALQA